MVELDCPGCGHHLRIGNQFAGKEGKCRYCKTAFFVPTETLETPHDFKQTTAPKIHINNSDDPLPGVSALSPGKESAVQDSIFTTPPQGTATPDMTAGELPPPVDPDKYKREYYISVTILIVGFMITIAFLSYLKANAKSYEVDFFANDEEWSEESDTLPIEDLDDPAPEEPISNEGLDILGLFGLDKDVDIQTATAVMEFVNESLNLSVDFMAAQNKFDQTDFFTFSTLKSSESIKKKMDIATQYIHACDEFINFENDSEAILRNELEFNDISKENTNAIVESFMKNTVESRTENAVLYTLHRKYGTSVRDSLNFLRSNDQYWQYDPASDFPKFSEPQKQDQFEKTLDKISAIEQTLNEHLLEKKQFTANSQNEF